jgi:hypothetical protein
MMLYQASYFKLGFSFYTKIVLKGRGPQYALNVFKKLKLAILACCATITLC